LLEQCVETWQFLEFYFQIFNIKKLDIHQSIMFWEKNSPPNPKKKKKKKKKKRWFCPQAKTRKRKKEKKRQKEIDSLH
jgi:hypothetical protein